MIYKVFDINTRKTYYIGDDPYLHQNELYLPDKNYIIFGDEFTAQKLLDQIRKIFIEKNIDQFTCYKEFPAGSNTSFSTSLSTEIENCNTIYYVFNPVFGAHVQCLSLEEAKDTQEKIKQEFCDFQNIRYTIFESIEELKQEFTSLIPIRVTHSKTIQYNETTLNIYHTKKGEGLPAHEHTFNHATVCVSGSCLVKTQNQEIVLTKDSDLIDLDANKWHEITALEDDTIFINIFPSNLANNHDSY